MDFFLYIWVFAIFENIDSSKVGEDLNGYVVLENYHSLKKISSDQSEDNNDHMTQNDELEMQDHILRGDCNAFNESIRQENYGLNNLERLTDNSTKQKKIYINFLENNYFKHVKELKEKSSIFLECNMLGKSSYNIRKEFKTLEYCCNNIVLDFVLFLNYKRSEMGETIPNIKNFYVNGFSCSEDLIWTFYCEYKHRILVKNVVISQKYSLSWNLEDVKDSRCFFDKNFKIDIIKIDNDSDLAATYFNHEKITDKKVYSDKNSKPETLTWNSYEVCFTVFLFGLGQFIGIYIGVYIALYHILC